VFEFQDGNLGCFLLLIVLDEVFHDDIALLQEKAFVSDSVEVLDVGLVQVLECFVELRLELVHVVDQCWEDLFVVSLEFSNLLSIF
jgi:hypothetical protein